MRKLYALLLLSLASQWALAEPVTIEHKGLVLNASLETADETWQQKPVILMTHGTLAHGQMEIMATLQELFSERSYSSLPISLSLGLSERTGMYDCPVPHNHKHTDAIEEIGLWQQWLTGQGVDSIILLGHSRGGNQTAWYASELKEGSPVKGTVLIAPASNGFDYLAADYKKRYEVDLAPLVEKANKLVADGKGDTMMENVDFIYCQKTSATAASFANYYADDPRMETTYILKEFSQPVMVFAGSEDTVVVNLEEKIEALGEKENIQMSVIDGADHFFRDLYAEDLADETVEFIESL
ncbi:hypothetical protein BOW28_10010 [Solemya velum gill symbiont]|uniref:alpha/beta hydrolase n=1 Tax=Solemya velum gill symbiont TaxID=2340 RepID=UPI0009985400|nr:alpha/beta hydrolase [Solemya velum gill symbiont]OOZ16577.1 hypothetical protein BOW28_10010 [Solemya velum gill symbiont]OOZ26039.1 hypothetical protein BOW32_10095 [Solemya velum gill symbiont]